MAQLPADVLHKVFCFVGDSQELLACERTCQAFRKVLEDDAIWGYCHEVCKPKRKYFYRRDQRDTQSEELLALFPPSSNRDKAFTLRALKQCYDWGRSATPATLAVLGVPGWKALVESAKSEYFPANLGACRHKFPIRGDTSAVLMEVLETCLVTQLKRAKKIAVHSAQRASGPKTTHPTVLVSDFLLQDEMHPFVETPDRCNLVANIEVNPASLIRNPQPIDLDLVSRFPDHITSQQKFQIVRRLAYRAGVVKLEDELFKLVWATLLKVVLLLLKPGCRLLASRAPPPAAGELQILREDLYETMREFPPLAELGQVDGCPNCHNQGLIHWLVPKQVEEAGKQLGIPARVYGNEWHIDEMANDSNLTEMELAKSKYRLVKRDDEDGAASKHSGTRGPKLLRGLLSGSFRPWRTPRSADSDDDDDGGDRKPAAVLHHSMITPTEAELAALCQQYCEGEPADLAHFEELLLAGGHPPTEEGIQQLLAICNVRIVLDDDGGEEEEEESSSESSEEDEEESSSESSFGSEDDDGSYVDEGESTDDDLDLYVNASEDVDRGPMLPSTHACVADNTFTR